MANFRMYPGLFVHVFKTFGPLKEGTTLQVMNTQWGYVSFVGINGNFKAGPLGQYVEPVYPEVK